MKKTNLKIVTIAIGLVSTVIAVSIGFPRSFSFTGFTDEELTYLDAELSMGVESSGDGSSSSSGNYYEMNSESGSEGSSSSSSGGGTCTADVDKNIIEDTCGVSFIAMVYEDPLSPVIGNDGIKHSNNCICFEKGTCSAYTTVGNPIDGPPHPAVGFDACLDGKVAKAYENIHYNEDPSLPPTCICEDPNSSSSSSGQMVSPNTCTGKPGAAKNPLNPSLFQPEVDENNCAAFFLAQPHYIEGDGPSGIGYGCTCVESVANTGSSSSYSDV